MSQSGSEATGGTHPPEWGEQYSRTITWFRSDRLRPAAAHLSGVEYLEAVAAGTLPPPPVTSLANMRLVSITHGAVVLRAIPDTSWLNTIGSVHGGLVATLLDSAMGMAVISTLDSVAQTYTTIEFKVSFLKPAPFDGREVELRGRTLRVGRKIAFAEAHAYDPSGTLISHATSSLAAID